MTHSSIGARPSAAGEALSHLRARVSVRVSVGVRVRVRVMVRVRVRVGRHSATAWLR